MDVHSWKQRTMPRHNSDYQHDNIGRRDTTVIDSSAHIKCSKRHGLQTKSTVKYGELVILGHNGSLPQGNKGRRRSKFMLKKREEANGVKAVKQHLVQNPHQSEFVQDSSQHSVSFPVSRSESIVVEYSHDSATDMFQIGRSPEQPIDFVVMDTVANHEQNNNEIETQSTISRFACRILIDREPPYTARIYAAGFDSDKNIFLGEKGTKWHNDSEIDGLTTNGVLIMHPNTIATTRSSTVWREVSVRGGLYALRESRSVSQQSNQVYGEDNVLVDGTLIDLCGATLMWRSAQGLQMSPCKQMLESQILAINRARPQCPVGLNTLVLSPKGSDSDSPREKSPYVYMACGHVHGHHEWGIQENNNRICPICRKSGPYVKLRMGQEPSLYVDTGPPNYCFSPCAHMASENTVKYFAGVGIPRGCHGFQASCPFCACLLTGDTGYVRLIFQNNLHKYAYSSQTLTEGKTPNT